MNFFILFICLILTSCGAIFDKVQDDPRFHPIRDQFVKDAKAFGLNVDASNVRIAFGDVQKKNKFAGIIKVTKKYDNAEAYCLAIERSHNDLIRPMAKLALGKKYKLKVVVVSEKLINAPVDFLESLVYHELGHCVLGLGHIDNEYIMNSGGVDSLKAFRYFYLKELFKHQHLTIDSLYGLNQMNENLELIYQVDYVAFDKRIFYQLLYDHQLNEYFYNENPELL